jgi:glucose-6-phosphate 1-epimerase
MSKTQLPPGASLSDDGLVPSPLLSLEGPGGTARIALYGATLLSYVPKQGPSAGRDLLWLSPKATCGDGKPIRGGVPVCGPWFGPHPSLSTAPLHGLFRIRLWELVRVERFDDGTLRAELSLSLPPARELGWPHAAAATFVVTVGSTLSLELSVRNAGSSPFVLSEALHTHFAVSDVREVRVEGLAEREFVDLTGGGVRRRHGEGPVALTGEAAHFFLSSAPVRLVDPVWKQAVSLRSWGAASVPVWNPWEKAGAAQADIGAEWPRFLCVETANIPDTAVLLPPSQSHHLGVEISISAL